VAKANYINVQDGTWVDISMSGDHIQCCDCLLNHYIEFRRVGKKLQFRVWRDNRSTAAFRRYSGVKISKKAEKK
jgi:hypothetical protein